MLKHYRCRVAAGVKGCFYALCQRVDVPDVGGGGWMVTGLHGFGGGVARLDGDHGRVVAHGLGEVGGHCLLDLLLTRF